MSNKKFRIRLAAAAMAAILAAMPATTMAATKSPTHAVQPTREQNVAPSYNKVKAQVSLYDTWDNGRCSIKRVNPAAKTVTFSKISVSNGTVNGKKTTSKVQYSVVRVKRGAFAKAPKVKTVKFGSGMRQFDYKSFTGAKALRKIVLSATSLGKVDPGAFKGLDTSKIYVYVPKSISGSALKAIKLKLKAAGIRASHVRRSQYA